MQDSDTASDAIQRAVLNLSTRNWVSFAETGLGRDEINALKRHVEAGLRQDTQT